MNLMGLKYAERAFLHWQAAVGGIPIAVYHPPKPRIARRRAARGRIRSRWAAQRLEAVIRPDEIFRMKIPGLFGAPPAERIIMGEDAYAALQAHLKTVDGLNPINYKAILHTWT